MPKSKETKKGTAIATVQQLDRVEAINIYLWLFAIRLKRLQQ